MTQCISERDFELVTDAYDSLRAIILDDDGTEVATVNRASYTYDEGMIIAHTLCAAPAMLRALELALEAYSPNSHLLGVDCTHAQCSAARAMRAAISLALYGDREEYWSSHQSLQLRQGAYT
ncbi:hypothetical protein K6W76_14685 [Burkholderia anthina]|uniref:hypothetical protein n=1 Tax=Burkholderia anthina TaxID=179879 RepID=UPI00158CA941|nr:hypothetical protein [Burkholderia anthina]MBY4867741.1 hypothetical protein [Burkholderia anthina]